MHQPTLFDIEQWLPIPGWEGRYEVSNTGQVRSVPRTVRGKNGTPRRLPSRVLRQHRTGPTKYLTVTLSREGKSTHYRIHVVVAAAFIGPRPDGHIIRHLNGDQDDNRPENLTYGTQAENNMDQVRHGTHNEASKTHCIRGHLLAPPNLTRSGLQRGYRECLACTRARGEAKTYANPSAEMQWLSDDHYGRIMRTAA